MTIQDLTPQDLQRVEALHDAADFDYRLPTALFTPRYPVRRALSQNGHCVMAAALKVDAEAYLWVDHTVESPEWRLDGLKLLHADMQTRAFNIGFDQVYCVLPPAVAKGFGPRLEELGWVKSRPWPRYVFQLREP